MYVFTHVHTPYIDSWVYIGLLRSRPTLTSRLNAVLHYAIKVDRRCINMCPYSLYELNTQIGLLRLRPTLTSRLNAAICYAIKVDRHIWLASIFYTYSLINTYLYPPKIPFSVSLQEKIKTSKLNDVKIPTKGKCSIMNHSMHII